MPTATTIKSGTGLQVQRRTITAQRKPDKRNNRNGIVRKENESPKYKYLPAPNSSGRFYPDRLTFQPRLGYELLKRTRIKTDFSLAEKITAYMLHACMKHMKGYKNCKFSDVNEAVAYVFKMEAKLIHSQYTFRIRDCESISNIRELPEPDGFQLHIVHEEFGDDGGRWQSYGEINNVTKGKPDYRKALYMCLHIINYKFGFTLFDEDGGEGVMDMESWYEFEMENALDELHHAVHADKPVAEDIKDAEDRIQSIKEVNVDYERYAVPIQKRIRKTKISPKFLKLFVDNNQGTDIGDWVAHVLMLYDYGFHIENFMPGVHNFRGDQYEEETMGFSSAFGLIYDGDNYYAKHMNENFNEYANNYGVRPLADFDIIHPIRGYIRTACHKPVYYWIKKLFSFNIADLMYET